MMLCDGYGNAISTKSSDARDHYAHGVQLFLGGDFGAAEAFEASLTADPDFALGHVGLARVLMMEARMPEAKEDCLRPNANWSIG